MKTIAEMRARLEEITSRMSEIHEEAGEAALSEERQTEWDDLDTEYAETEKKINSAESRSERMKSFAASTPGAREKGTDQGSPAFVRTRTEREIYDVDSLRSEARDEYDFADLCRDNAMRAVEKARFSRMAKREAAQDNAAYLLDNVDDDEGSLAQRFLLTGSPLYERAFAKTVKHMSTAGLNNEELRAMALSTNLGADGGYAVPFQLDPSVILTNDGATNPLRQMSRIEQITGKEWQGVTSDGVTVARAAEAAESTDNSPDLAQPTVKAERVHGFIPFSIEIDQDWNQFRSEMSRMLQDAKDREEASSFVVGNGSSPNANGVVSTLSGNTVTAAGTANFGAADVYKLEESLAPRWRTGKAQFLGNHTIYNLIRQFADTDGHKLWERIGAGQPPELLGYQAREASAMSSTLTTGQKILLFGDFSNFLIVDRVGMSVELVPHLFGTVANFPTGQRGIYAIWRNNSKILVDKAFKLLVTG